MGGKKVFVPRLLGGERVLFFVSFCHTKGSGGRGGKAPRGREKQAIEIKEIIKKIIKNLKVLLYLWHCINAETQNRQQL